jgi:hypothetical protein
MNFRNKRTAKGIKVRPVMNPISFYLSELAKEQFVNQVDTAKRLQKLALEGNVLERRRVAEHPETTVEILIKLSRDTEPDVRLAAAEHPNIPYLVLKQLVQDSCLNVRLGLAENSNLPVSILEILIKDENPYIRDKAIHSFDKLNCSRSKEAMPCA